MATPNTELFPSGIASAVQDILWDGTPEKKETTGQIFSYTEGVLRVLASWNLIKLKWIATQPTNPVDYEIWLKPAELINGNLTQPEAKIYSPDISGYVDLTPELFATSIISVAVNDATVLPNATTVRRGLMAVEDKLKLNSIESEANKYIHSTEDGNLHIPPTSTTNNGKVLKAGDTEGSAGWGSIQASEVVQDADRQFITLPEKVAILALINQSGISINDSVALI